MPYLQHFFIEGKHLGTTTRGNVFVHGELQAPTSVAYFCPKCAEIWARGMVEGSPHCEVRSVDCRKHPSRVYTVAGSLTSGWDEELNEAFPAEVLRWELERHFNYYEGATA